MKLNKENCIPGTRAVVNDKKSKWNEDIGATKNGLVCFPFAKDSINGTLMGQEGELIPGTQITILSKPKRFNENGNQVKFTIDGDTTVYSAWWICIKAKVDTL